MERFTLTFFRLDRNRIPSDALFSIYCISRVNELNDAFRAEGYGNAKLASRVKRSLPRMLDASSFREMPRTRTFQPSFGVHLRICLGKLDSRLTCSLVASPFSTDSSPSPVTPSLGQSPVRPDSLRRITTFSLRRRISRPSLAPGTFRREFAPIVARQDTSWGPRIGPLSSELSVNAPFVSSFL